MAVSATIRETFFNISASPGQVIQVAVAAAEKVTEVIKHYFHGEHTPDLSCSMCRESIDDYPIIAFPARVVPPPPDPTDDDPPPPLVLAATTGDLPLIKRILASGYFSNLALGRALIKALENNHLDIAETLITIEGIPHLFLSLVLYAASATGHLDLVKAILAVERDVRKYEISVTLGEEDSDRLLLEAPHQLVGTSREIALFYASANGQQAIVETLIATSRISGEHLQIAKRAAEKRGHTAIVQTIQQALLHLKMYKIADAVIFGAKIGITAAVALRLIKSCD